MADVQEQTFEERLIAKLEDEYSEGTAVVEEDSDEGTPPEPAESEGEAEGALSDSETDDETEDSDDGTPDEDSEEVTEWEQRYKDAQAELTRYQQNRDSDAREHSEALSEVMRVRYDLEDKIKTQDEQGKFLAQMMTNNAQQYRNINWSQVPPDQLPQLQQQAQQAFMQEQQVNNAYSQQQQQAQAIREESLKREASIARQRLVRTIPDFDDSYKQMAEYAQTRGMDLKQFNEIVDPAVMEMIYDSMKMRQSSQSLEIEKQPKAKPPKTRLSPDKPRDAKGRYLKAEQKFRQTKDPRQRLNAWEEKTRQRLAGEGKGR